MLVAERIILVALFRGNASDPFTACLHEKQLSPPPGYLTAMSWNLPTSRKILCSRALTFMHWKSNWSRKNPGNR